MFPARLWSSALVLAFVPTLAPGPAWSDWPTAVGDPLIINSTSTPHRPQAIPDGSGGVIVVWQDYGTSGYKDVHALRYGVDGERDPGWPAQGVPVLNEDGNQHYFNMDSDGAGGVFVAAEDSNHPDFVAVNHILADGSVAAGWPATRSVMSELGAPAHAYGHYIPPGIAADGAGGVYVSVSTYNGDGNYGAARVLRLNSAGMRAAGWLAAGTTVSIAADLDFWPALASVPGGVYVCFSTATGTFVQRLLDDGSIAPGWPAGGIQVGGASHTQPVLAADGAGGVVAAWNEGAIAVQRLAANGTFPAGWPPGAKSAGQSSIDGTSLSLEVTPDVIYVGWSFPRGATGHDVFTQALDPNGAVLWTPTGHPVSVASGDQHDVSVSVDEDGGVFYSWRSYANGSTQLGIQHLETSGGVSPGWPQNGRFLSLPVSGPRMAIVGGNAAFLTWSANTRVYAHRIDRYNFIGDPAAALTSVEDVEGDQGGMLRLTWTSSYIDVSTWQRAGAYHVERLAGELGAAAAATAWERIASVAPDGSAQYVLDVSTAGGVSGTENQFRIVTESINGPTFGTWASGTLAGAALDNLPPDVPPAFGGTAHANGTLELSWEASEAPDLAGYALYRGDDAGFAPDEANLVVETAATSHVVDTAGGAYFKLAAVDVNGNASTFAVLDGTALVEVTPLQRPLAFHAVAPNPASAQARVSWSLPETMPVDLAVYDVTGRRVRTLAAGSHAPGDHAIEWSLADAGGRRLPVGLYFLRLTVPGQMFTRRIVVAD